MKVTVNVTKKNDWHGRSEGFKGLGSVKRVCLEELYELVVVG